MNTILYSVALDISGNYVKASDAEKGNEFYCPVCKGDMILRKSGNTTKGSKRPHYAHQALTPNCTPESALHHSFKNLLTKKIQEHLDTGQPLVFSWLCEYCGDVHSGNLLKKIARVELEFNLSTCQPDIALLDNDNNVFAVIEVVVTHKPEETVLEYYKKNNIILIQINLTSDQDIEHLNDLISKPTIVNTCFNPRCKTCGNFQQKKIMTIVDGPCWKCGATMKIAAIYSSKYGMLRNGSNYIYPSDFLMPEVDIAKSKGVILKKQYSRAINENYLANSCPKCGKFVGDNYIFEDYISPSAAGEFPFQSFDIGYICEHCEEERFEDEEY